MSLRRTAPVAIMLSVSFGCSRAPETYAANCSTPLPHWGREQDGIGDLRFVQPVYVGSDGSILWNKALITDATLRDYVAKMSVMDPYPQVVLEVAPAAACQRVVAVRKIIDAAPFCHGPRSLCSEGSNWKQWPVAK